MSYWNDKKKERDDLYDKVQELQKDEYDLTEWEENFVVSMEERIEKKWNLSDAQKDKIKEIHDRYVDA